MSDDFEKTADKLPGAFKTLRETVMQKVVYVALAASQKRTPVRTGTLRRSETGRVADQGRKGYLGTNVRYAPFVHARKPFFKEGIQDARPDIDRILQEAGLDWAAEVAE